MYSSKQNSNNSSLFMTSVASSNVFWLRPCDKTMADATDTCGLSHIFGAVGQYLKHRRKRIPNT